MSEKVNCSICQHVNQKGDIYCVNCGSILPTETWDNRVSTDQKQQILQQPSSQDLVPIAEKKETKTEKKKWYKPPKRTRPAYHPLEWLFWIGWSFYVVFGFIGIGIWLILREIYYYMTWCCCWGPPREMNKR